MVGCSFLLTVIMGGLLSLLTRNFWYTCQYMFFLFFAFPIVTALLLVFTNIQENLAYEFGAGLYYGTLVMAAITQGFGWNLPDLARIFLSSIISALICYIVYLKNFKRKQS